MKETRVFIALLMVLLLGSGMAQAAKITVCIGGGCNYSTLQDAIRNASENDTISLESDLTIQSNNTPFTPQWYNEVLVTGDKSLTVEGNNHIINASLPMWGTAIKLTKPSVVNNFSLMETNYLGAALRVENMNNVVWNNIKITYLEKTVAYEDDKHNLYYSSNFKCCFNNPGSAGISIFSTNNFTLVNYTASDTIVALWVVGSPNITVKKINVTGTHMLNLGFWGALSIDSKYVTIDDYSVSGYDRAVEVGPSGGSTIISSNITLRNGRTKNTNYGVTGGTYNLTVTDSVFDDSAVDIMSWGDNNYTLRNNSIKAGVILPSGQILNLLVYSFPNITILGKNYSLVNGFDIRASCSSGANCTVRFYYNTSLVTNLHLNVSTFKVWHVTDPVNNTGEWLAITNYNATEGWVEISTGTFSPFYLVAEQDTIPPTPPATPTPTPSTPTPTPSTPTSSSGGGSGGSSGGSGGGVVTDEDSANVNNHQSIDGNLQAGKEVRYDFDKVGAGIFYTFVTGKENEYDVTIRVENLKAQSKKALTPAPNTVYLYTNIISSSQRIQSAKIGFKVPNTWLDSNKIDPSTVKMYRLVNGSWNALETTLVGNDVENSIYETASAGFSKFAITGEVQPSIQPTAVILNPAPTPKKTMDIRTATSTATPETPGFELVVALLATAGAIIACRKVK